jgi:hypothetical protein
MKTRALFPVSLFVLSCSIAPDESMRSQMTGESMPFSMVPAEIIAEMTIRTREAAGEIVDRRVSLELERADVALRATEAGDVMVEDLFLRVADEGQNELPPLPFDARIKTIQAQMLSATSEWTDDGDACEARGTAELALGYQVGKDTMIVEQPPRPLKVVAAQGMENQFVSMTFEGAWLELPELEFRDLVVVGRQ